MMGNTADQAPDGTPTIGTFRGPLLRGPLTISLYVISLYLANITSLCKDI